MFFFLETTVKSIPEEWKNVENNKFGHCLFRLSLNWKHMALCYIAVAAATMNNKTIDTILMETILI